MNSKISNRGKNTRLTALLFCHYCWSLLWCNYWKSLKSDSHLPKNPFNLRQWKPFKNDEKWFLFHLKSSPPPQDIKNFVLTFGPVKKLLNKKIGEFQNIWRHSLVNNQLHYTYCAISRAVKAIRQWNLVRQ